MTNKKTYIAGGIAFFFLIAGLSVAILRGANAWFEVNRLVFKRPVEVTLNKPISVEASDCIIENNGMFGIIINPVIHKPGNIGDI